MEQKKGSLSINSENIFPIIKKWLYSDHDIFIRELVSNACDAITKLKKLSLMGEYEEGKSEEYKIYVEISPKAKTISFIDNGIGMDYKEVDEYINQIAFSGAKDFLDKYKDKANEEQIIGHFGLGFYSAFMVADRVEIDTLSYKAGSEAVHWESNGGTEYEMSEGSLKTHGTKITLHLNDNSYEFSNEYRVREVLNKYCAFMPVSIYLKDSDAGELSETIDVADLKDTDVVLEKITEPAKTEEKTLEDGTKEVVEVAPAREKAKIRKREVAVNDTTPLWTKHPNECSDEDYKDFYRKVFMDYKEPLFWIHLNMDYPFNLKGILYFPKINTEYDSIEGTIKLYNNQVFIADNIKEVIPEFLMLLKGVIDCPDLPLNVSRSALQNDGFVKKISDYISKKVADKLSGMCRTDRENYEKYWDDIAPFIKFGCLKDEKFADKVKDGILFKDIYDKYQTFKDLELEEAKEEVKEEEVKEEVKDKKENKIYYVNDVNAQSQYINMFKEANKQAVVLPHNIDMPFIQSLEAKMKDVKFVRIDGELSEELAGKEHSETEKENFDKLVQRAKDYLAQDKLNIEVKSLKNEKIASLLIISEESRRMEDMMKQYAMMGLDPSMFGGNTDKTLILNSSHSLVQKLLATENKENEKLIIEHLYDLAELSNSSLSPERMSAFIQRANTILSMIE
ncbi:MAG: molecular chaperone HtpG [Lachnospiraceae bacterium]|mgnify:FL=1|nr:MAG: molecular chaperone HtpG [Lachnospiraceae bacterium]